ncbi:MAG: TonB-dependent receptor [Paludibacter sp.]|jgi:TonB-linked SusC/RagA family outer membrane protein
MKRKIITNPLKKTLLKGCLLLFMALFSTGLNAQITVDVSNQSLKEILKVIEIKSEYRFFYNEGLKGLDKISSLRVKNATIEKTMTTLLENTDILFKLEKNNLVVLVAKVKENSITQKKLTGLVTDDKGQPIIGASIKAKGISLGTISDTDGKFSLAVPSDAQLVVSYIGYITKEIQVLGKDHYDIILIEDTKLLNEVVVIGYGTVKKRDLTGAVSSIKSSDMDIVASSSIGSALKAKAAGLSIIQNSAQPGGGLDILIRGAGSINASNTPLYIVDGFPIATLDQPGSGNERLNAGTQSILNFVNPNDISSVEVLKDASATAIYGARAAHGVVLITTKRGVVGRTVVSYDATYAIQKHSNIFDVYNLKDWMSAKNNASWDTWMWENQVTPYGNRTLETAMNSPKNGVKYALPYTDSQINNAGIGTDWVGLITRIGSIEQHNVSVQSGTDQTKFMASLNYFDNKGIIKNSEMKRYTGKINLDQTINKYFKIGINLTASRIDNANTPLGAGQWEKSGLLRAAVQMGPQIQAIDENGNYPINPMLPTQPNPYSLLTIQDYGLMDRFLANAHVIAEPIKDLTLKFSIGTDIASQSRKTYMPKTTLFGGLSGGIATINQSLNEQYLLEGTANYNFKINNKHQIGVLLGTSTETFNANGHNVGNNDFLTDGFAWNNLNAGEGTKIVGSWGNENNMISYFTRLNYTLLDRYLFTATLRADGASVFAKNNKWGYFPSIAVGWNMIDESFMKFARPTISMFKIRVSYGQTGNSSIGSNAFASYSAAPAWNTVDNLPLIGVFQSRLENPDLKWETTTELNLGLDIAMFDGKVSGSFEFYNRVISDLLNYKPLNAYHDVSLVMANIGKTQGKGFEATINTKNITHKNFTWTTDFVFSLSRDRWLERTNDWKPTVYENPNDPIRSIYSRVAVGILQVGDPVPAAQPDLKPGQLIIKDINGYKRDENGDPVVENGRFMLLGKPDGIIDDADTRLMGTTDPGYIAGISNHFKINDFDLSFDFNGLFDRVMMDPTYMAYGSTADGISQYGYNGLRILDKRWMPDNPSTIYPSSFYGWSNYGYGDWFYQKAWFIRLQNITLGYTLPEIPVLKKIFSSFRVYVDFNNVFVITPYTGLDPETDAYAAAYPNARTFTFGLDVKF